MGLSAYVLLAVLSAASLIDLRSRRIPNWLTGGGAVLISLCSFLGDGIAFSSGFEWALLLGVPLGCLSVIRPSGFGMGDVKLVVVVALATGSRSLGALLIACAAALFYAIREGAGVDSGLPFAPFMSAGAVASLVIG